MITVTMTTDETLRNLLLTKSIKYEGRPQQLQRPQIARANYSRRRYQYKECGYKSPITKPYQELGEVILDDKQLVLNTLGRTEWDPCNQVR